MGTPRLCVHPPVSLYAHTFGRNVLVHVSIQWKIHLTMNIVPLNCGTVLLHFVLKFYVTEKV
jgi:hypothetical protein